jgi:hypothetical protein
LFCGGWVSVSAGLVCRGVVCVGTGRTTCSFHWEGDVTDRMSWAPRTFIVTSSLLTAWLMYGSRSSPILVSA